jgi:hypothetical protein
MFRAAAAATLALVVALPATAAPPRRAALKLESIAPLTISGRHFVPGEWVLLRYTGPGDPRPAVGVRVTRKGAFRALFPIRPGRCDSFTVRATGSRRSRAVLQVERRCENAKGPPKRPPREQAKPGKA